MSHGAFCWVDFNFAPRGWALCDGSLLPISGNEALYSLLGPRFGGDGRSTFALPDLRDKAPNPETQYYIAMSGVFPPRQ